MQKKKLCKTYIRIITNGTNNIHTISLSFLFLSLSLSLSLNPSFLAIALNNSSRRHPVYAQS